METTPTLPKELAEREALAVELAARDELVRALNDAARDPSLWNEVEREPGEFLRARGIDVPEGLSVEFLTDPAGRPAPDYDFFTIRFFNCRTYWIKKPGGAEKVEICRGFQIIPHPLPPIA